ncbi:unnamed protein product [Nippostrongylus brasiliensis]|uniref:Uncharacterized protein n=1 Tax=Nippostrongylus brasiliensis TaxID=27835 RepID=A0A0N4XKB4_NIPBR|nr:unnamed protein product [Nippostrongylus brasiliensis]
MARLLFVDLSAAQRSSIASSGLVEFVGARSQRKCRCGGFLSPIDTSRGETGHETHEILFVECDFNRTHAPYVVGGQRFSAVTCTDASSREESPRRFDLQRRGSLHALQCPDCAVPGDQWQRRQSPTIRSGINSHMGRLKYFSILLLFTISKLFAL